MKLSQNHDRLEALKSRNHSIHPFSLLYSSIYPSLYPISVDVTSRCNLLSYCHTGLVRFRWLQMRVFVHQGLARLVETSKSKALRALPRIDAKKNRCFDAIRLVNMKKTTINNNRKRMKLRGARWSFRILRATGIILIKRIKNSEWDRKGVVYFIHDVVR